MAVSQAILAKLAVLWFWKIPGREEASLFALCDGQSALLLGTAQDHKIAGEGDKGANTGGMGAYSPAINLSQG